MHSKIIKPVFQPRHPKRKHRLSKGQIDLIRYSVGLVFLACSVISLFLTWGAMEIEEYANRQYEMEPKYNTESTCFFSKPNGIDIRCSHHVKSDFRRFIAYYGIRVDCALSTPMIAISIYLFVQDSYGKLILLVAHLCGWSKCISIAAALTAVLIDDPSVMREIFEKSQFGTYESKMLYSFTLAVVAFIANVSLVVVLFLAPFVPDKTTVKYYAGPNHQKQYKNCRVCPNTIRVVAKQPRKQPKSSDIAVVETIFQDDQSLEDTFTHIASPV